MTSPVCISGDLATSLAGSLAPCSFCGGDVLKPGTRSGVCHVGQREPGVIESFVADFLREDHS